MNRNFGRTNTVAAVERELKLSRRYRRLYWVCSTCQWRVRAYGRTVNRPVAVLFEAHACRLYVPAPKTITKQKEPVIDSGRKIITS
jgi:hypothetical protein